jgi:hypothetical protein
MSGDRSNVLAPSIGTQEVASTLTPRRAGYR